MPPTDREGGSRKQRPRRTRRRVYALLAMGSGLVLLGALGAAAVLYGLLSLGERSLQRVDVEGIEASGELGGNDDAQIEEIDEVLHVLVVGSDRREGLSEQARRELGTGDVDGDRTDTIMLVRLDPTVEEVAILSFPRDLLVTRCDGSRGKINAAYHVGQRSGIGGPSCLVQTITQMSGLSIHHFVELDFAGFLELVDIVEGVTVYLEEPIDDPLAHIDLAAGCHRLAGVDALGFVRHRASDSDYGRIARQQRFAKELVREASSLSSLLNVPRLFQMVEAGASAVTTDQELTLDKMRRITFTLRDLEPDNMVARTVPADHERINRIDFEIVREEEAQRLYAAFAAGRLGDRPDDADDRDDGPDDRDEQPDLGGSVAVNDVPPLRVLNSTNIAGLAGAVSDQLSAIGFTIEEIDNVSADPAWDDVAVVRHPPELAGEAELLAGYLPDSRLEERADFSALEVVLGQGVDPERVRRSTDAGAAGEAEAPVIADEGAVAEAESEDERAEKAASPPAESGRQFVGAQQPPDYCR